MNPQPVFELGQWWFKTRKKSHGLPDDKPRQFPSELLGIWDACPYGKSGDRLWVRETWRIVGWDWENGDWTIEYKADCKEKTFESCDEIDEDAEERYAMECTDACHDAGIQLNDEDRYVFDEAHPCPTKWKPSIFLPRPFSRITLEIVSVRVERVQDITEQDARAEGVDYWSDSANPARFKFMTLWDRINSKRGYGWDANPWVWVVEFKRAK